MAKDAVGNPTQKVRLGVSIVSANEYGLDTKLLVGVKQGLRRSTGLYMQTVARIIRQAVGKAIELGAVELHAVTERGDKAFVPRIPEDVRSVEMWRLPAVKQMDFSGFAC